MKNRNIPFGYRVENGTIIQKETESKIIKGICADYLDGISMLTIAKRLNDCHVEYMPGVTGWNKARIKRIVEDERYLGKGVYPPIIDQDTYDTIQKIKKERNTQQNTDRGEKIYRLSVPVCCPACGAGMKRRTDIRLTIRQRWTCTNYDCKTLIEKSDEDLLTEITALMNRLIAEPEQVYIAASKTKPSTESRKAENEIGRILDTTGFDKDTLRKKLLECVSLKYGDIDSTPYTAKRLKAEFERSDTLSGFSAELVDRTVKSIQLDADGNVDIILLNDQRIRKEKPHDSGTGDTAAKSGADHSTDH